MAKRINNKVAIVGGGASGMIAAYAAASRGASVTIYEKNNRVGKKLLATGNGRCNITNTDCSLEHFRGENPEFARHALEALSPKATIKFFSNIGLICKLTHGGRVFPYCEQAFAVLDVLRFAIERVGVKVQTNTEVVAAAKTTHGFDLRMHTPEGGNLVRCDRLIISTGGKAAPSTGSNGSGFTLLSSFGHRIVEPYPALAQLKTNTELTASLRNHKVNGSVAVLNGSRVVAESKGEILFTAYGLSGPAVMDISAAAITTPKAVVTIDLMPHMSESELMDFLIARKERIELGDNFLVGMINKMVGQTLAKRAGLGNLELLAKALKRQEFTVKGHTGWENAQVTGGGADTSRFSPLTMESELVSGLYATGETLDILGDCGGYNLQWAWSSGYAAGKAAGAGVKA